MDIYSLYARLLNPAAMKWVLRLLAAGFVAAGVFAVANSAEEYAAMHGISGQMQIGRCVEADAHRQTAWKCHGSFAGEDGSRIPDVVMTVTGSPLGEPTGTYLAMVASATATTAYPPGSQDFPVSIIAVVLSAGGAGILGYLSMPSVMRRRPTPGPRRQSGRSRRTRAIRRGDLHPRLISNPSITSPFVDTCHLRILCLPGSRPGGEGEVCSAQFVGGTTTRYRPSRPRRAGRSPLKGDGSMRSYTVTITPDDGIGAETVVKLQVDGTTPRITKLELTAAAGQTLATSQLPAINLEMLLASVQPATSPTVAPPPAVAAPVAEPAATPRGRQAPAGRDRASTAETTPKTKPAPKPKATSARGAKAGSAKKTQKAPTPSGRAYRTIPDDFAAVYRQANSVGAVADHYGVPRHTAQNWVATARRRDLIPAGRRRAGNSPAAGAGQGLFLAPASH